MSNQPALGDRLEPGPYRIGYRRWWEYDAARVYDLPFAESGAALPARPRPILVDLWYPAAADPTAPPMPRGEYLRFDGIAAGLEPFARRLEAFNVNSAGRDITGKPYGELSETERAELERALQVPTTVIKEAVPAAGVFPVVVYHPGLGNPVGSNSALCEWLASHGYGVVTSAFQPEDAAFLNIDWDLERSDQDMSFLVNVLNEEPFLDVGRLGVAGCSYGAQAAIAWRAVPSSPVRAVVSLDSTLEYWPPDGNGFGPLRERLKHVDRMTAPMLLFARPLAPPLTPRAPSFDAYEPLRYAECFYARVPYLNHNEFGADATFGAEIRRREHPDADDAERIREHCDLVCRLTRWFLDAFLKQDTAAAAALHAAVTGLQDGPTTFSLEHRPAAPLLPTARQLMDRALATGADSAVALWDRLAEPDEVIPLFDAGRWLLAEGHLPEALRLLEACADRSPRIALVYEALGDARLADGQRERAAEAYERAIFLYQHHTVSNDPEHLEATIQELSRRVEELRRAAE